MLVGDEEESCAGGGTDNGGADAPIDAAEAACCDEASGGLETGFEGVKGVEGEVDCCACESAGLGGEWLALFYQTGAREVGNMEPTSSDRVKGETTAEEASELVEEAMTRCRTEQKCGVALRS